MSDLDDPYDQLEHPVYQESHKPTEGQNNKILSRFRNFANSSLSSLDFLFSSSPTDNNLPALEDGQFYNTPTPTRPQTPQSHKRIFRSLRGPEPALSHSSSNSTVPSSGSERDDTPPLTPDSFSLPSLDQVDDLDLPDLVCDDQEKLWNYTNVKEGKKPEPPIDYIVDDISFDAPSSRAAEKAPVVADSDEWYGLEYTLELSCRERRPSDADSNSSRESWAAIHLGTIDPYYEEEEFYHWTRWHRYLDQLEERRKHRRGLEFKAHCSDQSWIYLDDMRTRELYYWQMETFGRSAHEVTDRLTLLSEYRKDIYCPPQKHDLAWFLKRSRSLSSIRELRR
ncbi:hypothetical protein C8J56DRAFT_1162752, partial [Mycena floridula]